MPWLLLWYWSGMALMKRVPICVVVVCWRLQKWCRCWCALFLWWTVLVDMLLYYLYGIDWLLYYLYGVDWQLLRRRSFFLWNQATDARAFHKGFFFYDVF